MAIQSATSPYVANSLGMFPLNGELQNHFPGHLPLSTASVERNKKALTETMTTFNATVITHIAEYAAKIDAKQFLASLSGKPESLYAKYLKECAEQRAKLETRLDYAGIHLIQESDERKALSFFSGYFCNLIDQCSVSTEGYLQRDKLLKIVYLFQLLVEGFELIEWPARSTTKINNCATYVFEEQGSQEWFTKLNTDKIIANLFSHPKNVISFLQEAGRNYQIRTGAAQSGDIAVFAYAMGKEESMLGSMREPEDVWHFGVVKRVDGTVVTLHSKLGLDGPLVEHSPATTESQFGHRVIYMIPPSAK